ncbi:uncharacterized protein LOC100372531 [Saccoglossus kowalevskii]|uniref:Uncharacterized protein LOC100372531 n=1 Tax=Saccoglossus kowalevskii TaxID=10224 RepID=A0ABM0GU73_SACKO|nr:PREDICTED: uncharacterized protein LOC100372531 [Saccoglossus kowalevskii]
MCRHRTALVIVFVIFLDYLMVECKMFQYPRYSYKKKPKSERRFKSERNKCDNDAQCANVPPGLPKLNCIRQCMSQKCYDDIYAFDELEDGEIDVRLTSFKGCWTSEYIARNRDL